MSSPAWWGRIMDYEKLGTSHPKLTRGLVACRTCGREQRVDSAAALQHGWPKCCGYTMTLDVEDVRAALAPRAPATGREG